MLPTGQAKEAAQRCPDLLERRRIERGVTERECQRYRSSLEIQTDCQSAALQTFVTRDAQDADAGRGSATGSLEINATSPAGIQETDRLNGATLERTLWDATEGRT